MKEKVVGVPRSCGDFIRSLIDCGWNESAANFLVVSPMARRPRSAKQEEPVPVYLLKANELNDQQLVAFVQKKKLGSYLVNLLCDRLTIASMRLTNISHSVDKLRETIDHEFK